MLGSGLPSAVVVTSLVISGSVPVHPGALAVLFGTALITGALVFSGHRRLAVEILTGKNTAYDDWLYGKVVLAFLITGLALIFVGFLDLMHLLNHLK